MTFSEQNLTQPDRIKSIIFDFDGTLCSHRYFASLGQEALDAISVLVFNDNSAAWADRWMAGELTQYDIADYLSTHLGRSAEEILNALHEGCSNMSFHPAVYAFARKQHEAGRKTALVTANMDVFTEIVVPAHGLDTVFDVILNTADHGTLDKSVLWRNAFRAFGPEYSYSTALLIEDSPAMVAQFESLGGSVYRYEGENALVEWLHETGFTTMMANGRSGAVLKPGRTGE